MNCFRVFSDVAQSFRYHLKCLSHEPLVRMYVALGLNLDSNASYLAEPGREAPHRR
jgi:hypothetical protein